MHDGRRRFAAHTMRLGEGVFRANLEREEQPRSLVVLALMGGALAAYAFWRDGASAVLLSLGVLLLVGVLLSVGVLLLVGVLLSAGVLL